MYLLLRMALENKRRDILLLVFIDLLALRPLANRRDVTKFRYQHHPLERLVALQLSFCLENVADRHGTLLDV